jgi:hypothetical protein
MRGDRGNQNKENIGCYSGNRKEQSQKREVQGCKPEKRKIILLRIQ